MDKEDFCQGCSQKNRCEETYEQLGKAQGPSVVRKVLVAFLLPIAVFIAALAVFERSLAEAVKTKQVQTALGFVLALSVTFLCILITRGISKQVSKKQL
ncbi:MAG: hypothetical protein ACYS76_07210 [Planctomycetota bacterium]|jgi:hypothetical protein